MCGNSRFRACRPTVFVWQLHRAKARCQEPIKPNEGGIKLFSGWQFLIIGRTLQAENLVMAKESVGRRRPRIFLRHSLKTILTTYTNEKIYSYFDVRRLCRHERGRTNRSLLADGCFSPQERLLCLENEERQD